MQKLCHSENLSFRPPPPMSFAKKWQTLTVKINFKNPQKKSFICAHDDLWPDCSNKTRNCQRVHEESFIYTNFVYRKCEI